MYFDIWYTYNNTNQSPVVAPVDAWVRCSKLTSDNSLTTGTWFASKYWKIASSCMGPLYNNGTPCLKNTTAGSLFGLYNFVIWLLDALTTWAFRVSLISSFRFSNWSSYLSQSSQFLLAKIFFRIFKFEDFEKKIYTSGQRKNLQNRTTTCSSEFLIIWTKSESLTSSSLSQWYIWMNSIMHWTNNRDFILLSQSNHGRDLAGVENKNRLWWRCLKIIQK